MFLPALPLQVAINNLFFEHWIANISISTMFCVNPSLTLNPWTAWRWWGRLPCRSSRTHCRTTKPPRKNVEYLWKLNFVTLYYVRVVLPLAVTLHRVIKAARITLRNFSDSWIPALASKIDDLSSPKKSVETTCEFERQSTQRIFLSSALIYLFFGVPQNSFHAGLSRLFDLGAEVTEGHWPKQRSSSCTVRQN